MLAQKNKYWQKLLSLLLFPIFLVLFSGNAFAEWIKHSGNPILSGTLGGWDGKRALECSILFQKNLHPEDLYEMWYVGNKGSGWRIGHAESSNGLNWNKTPNQEVIDIDNTQKWDINNPGKVEIDTTDPFVLYEDNIYKMWYSSISNYWNINTNDRFRLRYATSQDGLEWSEGNWILKGDEGKWDSGGIHRGTTLIKKDGIYHLWYAGTDNNWNWNIGYATSRDGLTWTKQNNGNPVITPTESWEFPDAKSVTHPYVLYNEEKNIFEMWYTAGYGKVKAPIVYAYSTNGVDWIKPTNKNPALEGGSSTEWDGGGVWAPFVIKEGNHYRMWYSGANADGSVAQIGYAEMEIPIPTPPQPLVLLPGLGASWNHRAIIFGEDVPQSEWYMTPGVKVYNGLIETLKNAGYQTEDPGKNLFVFNYNWTKPVNQIAEDLKNFIKNVVAPPEGAKIDLVGHSLGGLVARTYVQNNPDAPVDQLLTLGSPHQGVAQVYYPWEGGDLQQMPAWQRIGLGLLLYLRAPAFTTPKQTIQTVAPVLKDLLPTFDYLKQDSTPKPVNDMGEKNDWLQNLNISPPAHLLSLLNTFVGNISNSTLHWIKVENRNWLEAILNLWPDGKPTGEIENSDGDNTVLAESAKLKSASLIELSGLNHRDLVESTAGQQKIMEVLGLSPSSISTVSAGISYEPALVFLLASPATLAILGPDGNPAGEGDGKLVVVAPAIQGNYQIKITGTGSGAYHLYLGQLTENGDFWSEISGQITTGETQTRQINFQPNSPAENPLTDENGSVYNQSAQQKIKELKEYINNKLPSPKLKRLFLAQINLVLRLLEKNKIQQAISSLYELHFSISRLQKQQKLPQDLTQNLKNQIEKIITDLEQVYIKTNFSPYPPKKLKEEIRTAENFFRKMEEKLKNLQNQNKATPSDGALYLLTQEKLNKTKSENSQEAHIYALGARYLSLEGLVLFK